MRITKDGKVGIGVNNPNSPFVISSNSLKTQLYRVIQIEELEQSRIN